ncbi:hypothetical protein [Leisingera sp. F5]|uniref:hypothetical protein n=1 Tax=Leisingera sp. F5 TaxID=1813816 RepID=UPI000A49FA7C|nr:hypothetical protein [Leisingera sp. F5]
MTPKQQKALALARARRRRAAAQQPQEQEAVATQEVPQTNLVEQTMNGVNEGLAELAGLPVDLATGALNLGISGVNAMAGTDIDAISDPIGGSGSFKGAL